MTISCALSQSSLPAHHSAVSAGVKAVGGVRFANERLKEFGVIRVNSTGDRLKVPLLGIFQQWPIARHECVAKLARCHRDDPVGWIARRAAGQERACDQNI